MNWYKFSQSINNKRINNALLFVDIERQSGVAASIVNRVCHGQKCDVPAFERLCVWAEVNPLDYLEGGEKWKRS